MVKEKEKMIIDKERRCPLCGRVIPDDANVCPYCGNTFGATVRKDTNKRSGFSIAGLILAIIGLSTVWLCLAGIPGVALWLIIYLPLGIITIVFGSIGYMKDKLIKNTNYAVAAIIMGILIEVSSFVFMLIAVWTLTL